MSWSAAFIDRLQERTLPIMFELEVLAAGDAPGDVGYQVGTHRRTGVLARLPIDGIEPANVGYIEPKMRSHTLQGWSIQITDLGEICAHMSAGTVVGVYAGFPGWARADWQRIIVGVLSDITGMAPRWTMTVVGVDAALRSRMYRSLGAHSLFSSLVATKTVAAAYTPGDTTLEVSSTTALDRESGGIGMVQIIPSGGGSPFFLTWTGTASGPYRLTGVSSTGQLGTTAVAAAVGDTIQEVAYVYGHPMDLARKVMCSSLAGGNGPYDLYASDWGLALPTDLIDHDDIDTWRDTVVVASSGTYQWDLGIVASVADAFSWLRELLKTAGIFIVMRQGSLTMRALQSVRTPALESGITITDADVVQVLEYSAFDGRHRPEHVAVRVQSGGGFSTSTTLVTAATLPAAGTSTIDWSDRVWNNATAIRQDGLDRMSEIDTNVPERLVLACAGWRLAVLCNGDMVRLDLTSVHSRKDGAKGFKNRVALVAGAVPYWSGAVVKVALCVYPETDDVLG